MFYIKVKKHAFYVFYLQINVFNIYGSHNVTRQLTQVKSFRPNSRHAGWDLICLPRRNERLSWPDCLVY